MEKVSQKYVNNNPPLLTIPHFTVANRSKYTDLKMQILLAIKFVDLMWKYAKCYISAIPDLGHIQVTDILHIYAL